MTMHTHDNTLKIGAHSPTFPFWLSATYFPLTATGHPSLVATGHVCLPCSPARLWGPVQAVGFMPIRYHHQIWCTYPLLILITTTEHMKDTPHTVLRFKAFTSCALRRFYANQTNACCARSFYFVGMYANFKPKHLVGLGLHKKIHARNGPHSSRFPLVQ